MFLNLLRLFITDKSIIYHQLYSVILAFTYCVAMDRRKILVAEDEMQNIMLIERMLNKIGSLDITVVNDGVDVLDLMQKERFDLLILDVSMPRMNGIDAVRKIKENNGFLSGDIPIVLLSGNTPDYLTKVCKAEKIDFFVSKPFRYTDLLSIFTKLDFINEE